jgi:hypothetical protein
VALSRGRRASFIVATALLVVVCAEGLSALALRFAEGQWPYTRPKSANYLLFEPHPDWVVAPRKGVTVTVLGNLHHHNTDGFRGDEFPRVKARHRIACLGGSTTYCIGVANDQTWAFYLNQLLQPDYEVLILASRDTARSNTRRCCRRFWRGIRRTLSSSRWV